MANRRGSKVCAGSCLTVFCPAAGLILPVSGVDARAVVDSGVAVCVGRFVGVGVIVLVGISLAVGVDVGWAGCTRILSPG